MARFSVPLDSSAQAGYAELFDVVRHDELARSIENLSGSFSKKTVKGVVYWYYQFAELGTGKTRQYFVGPDTATLRALVDRARSKNPKPVERLANSAIALGCSAATPAHFRVIRRMNEVGLFRAGGLLVGTHAFLAYGNALGVSWGDIARTQDPDFAHAGSGVELALPHSLELDAGRALERLEAGFLPVPGLVPGKTTASFISKGDRKLRIDFITPMIGGREAPYLHRALGVRLQPLRFVELILADVGQAVVLSSVGATVVNVPSPARYALHKLLVYVERRVRHPEKADKDLKQAAALLEVLAASQSEEIHSVWKELLERGPGWRARARKALAALERLAPDLEALEPMRARLGRPPPRRAKSAR
ncbi:MAG: nucleotidyltransferase domain-containing protein [Myxococcales bacterium]|nr:nucleotidyltransferase domain-containing protein [Myxococcales bacterium]